MAKSLEGRDSCSLCGKTRGQVKKLIIGLHGGVCSDCIELCCDILHLELPPKPDLSPEQAKGGYALEVIPEIARTFPDPGELGQILMMLARSVEGRARSMVRSDEDESSRTGESGRSGGTPEPPSTHSP
ncbi:MAG TPA: ClpX C4-type zinc finger protein [Fimbriimonadaceae bacterium]|nr:ClpX C4-type zinc finger protein [Fimbriimonadaceae bacterium]